MFWDNFKRLCDDRNKTPSGVAKELGFSNAAPTHWKNGKSPTAKTLQQIADYFGVTVSYLLGEAQPAPETPQPTPDPLPPDIAELAEICEQLAQTKAGTARLQLLLEEAQRLLEEANIQEEKRKNLTK